MDTKTLESLIAVADSGSIAAAARSQNVTATAVSQRIRSLELELDCVLLSRVGHKAAPTEACRNLLPLARRLVTDCLGLYNVAHTNQLTGSLKLGATSTALTDYIPTIAKLLSSDAPHARLLVVPGTSASLYERLVKQEIDAALLVEPEFSLPKQLQVTHLDNQPLCVISSREMANQPLATTVSTFPLILYDRSSWGGKIAWRWIATQNWPRESLCELDALETIAILVEQGLGVAAVPEWADLSGRYDVAIHRPSSAKKYTRSMALLSHRGAAAQSLINLCSEALSRR